MRRRSRRVRDGQRSKLYRAERSVLWSDYAKELLSLDDVRIFLQALLLQPSVAEAFKLAAQTKVVLDSPRKRHYQPHITIAVGVLARRAYGGATAYWSDGGVRGIGFAQSGPSTSRWVAVHELAHLLVPRPHGPLGWTKLPSDGEGWSTRYFIRIPGHGREFRASYLALVTAAFGPEEARKLRQAFVAHGLTYQAPRQLTPEQREAAAIRLAACRPW